VAEARQREKPLNFRSKTDASPGACLRSPRDDGQKLPTGDVGFTLLPALTGRCRRPETCAAACMADTRAFPWARTPGSAVLRCSPALLWLQTLKAGKTQGTDSPSLHCSSALAAPAKPERGEVPSQALYPGSARWARFSCSHCEGSQEECSVPDISRQLSSSNLQASVRVRNRQPMGFRGWPTQPSRLVMVVAPRCRSSAKKKKKKGTERH